MTTRRALLCFTGLCAGLIALSCTPRAGSTVRVWEATRTIPTYEEGPPDPNPPFDLFSSTRFNYPYTMRTRLTDKRAPRTWRTLHLENEYLAVTVIPDLGGHLLSAVDKATGKEMFYANPSLKFAQVAYRGAWASYGVEFNFPVSHSWVTASPVDFATRSNPDGSASIIVGDVDRVYGMQWRVELILRPGRAVIEQRTTLYNRTDVRHRFYWWTNAAVEVWDDSQLVYPQTFTASHGFADVDTWPVNAAGVDLSRPGNHRYGPVSLFSHGSREPFMGIYHPHTGAGVVHYSPPSDLPAKKVWSWGCDADGLEWRKALSDNNSAVAEIQAGLYRNQETYQFLEPQESITFTEYWMPVHKIGGISRATPEAVVNMARTRDAAGDRVAVGFNVMRPVRGGRLKILQGDHVIADEKVTLTPADTYTRAWPAAGIAPCTVRLSDADGRVLIEHTEGRYDVAPADQVKTGPQATYVPPPAEIRREEDILGIGHSQELEGKLLQAYTSYVDGLARFPTSVELAKAAGRLAVDLTRDDEAVPRLQQALARVSNDAEAQYYLGCALAARGETAPAREALEGAAHARSWRTAAAFKLARLLAGDGRPVEALGWIAQAIRSDPDAARVGAAEVILLRRAGRAKEAQARLEHWQALDPINAVLRVESVRLGRRDDGLMAHLAGDPQRVLDVATDYMELGAWDDAVDVLSREYPVGRGVFSEPGAVAPQHHPEVAYYRGYCRERLGLSGRKDFDAASKLSTQYVFPHRSWTFPVLRKAIEANGADATAHFLLGSSFLSAGMADRAAAEWDVARRLSPQIPTLHRNMGMTVLYALGQPGQAAEVLSEGLQSDPLNPDVYLALDQALSLMQRPPEERLRALDRYPDSANLPSPLVFKRALGLVEAGRADEGAKMLAGRFFPREEFGTNVRQVYVEVVGQQALSRARSGRCGEAMALVQRLGQPVAGLPFTENGLAPFVESARAQLLASDVATACGDLAAARAGLERAAAAQDVYPYPHLAFGWQARRKLGATAMDAATRRRFEEALATWERRLVIGTNFPGPNACGRGLILRALGREREAKERFREALLLPDQLMSHYLSREALAAVSVPR
jgi:tetratricopeptide (TPR) repeat protein